VAGFRAAHRLAAEAHGACVGALVEVDIDGADHEDVTTLMLLPPLSPPARVPHHHRCCARDRARGHRGHAVPLE
jgi:hypothetical protein